MAGEIFISYRRADQAWAQLLHRRLRAEGVEAWYDAQVGAGQDWRIATAKALESSRIFVLLFSENAAQSSDIAKELAAATLEKKLIIPVRLQNIAPKGAFLYELASRNWVNAYEDTEAKLAELAKGLAHLLRTGARDESVLPLDGGGYTPAAAARKSMRGPAIIAAAAVLVIAVSGITAWLLWRSFRPAAPGTAQATSQDVAQKAESATPVFSPPAHSVAVLPFVNMSGDPKEDYFSDGISEELLNALSRLNDLQVVARTSSFSFKGQNVDMATIAHKLNVGAVLEGSVRRAGNTVRITAQLINTVTGFHLWSDTYDRPFTDIFKIQTEVATAVAQQLETRLAGDELTRLEVGGTKNPAAYEDFLQGLQALNLRTKAGFEHAIADFSSAVARDPRYAIAYAELARTYSLAPIFGISTPTETMPKARDAATRALALNEALADAHTALGFIMAHFEFDWPAAEREYLRGLALNPSDAQGHFFYSNSYLSPFGRHEQAIAEMKKAAELDPLSPAVQAFMGRTYLWARRYDEALAQFKKSNDLNPNLAVGHERLAHLYTYLGRFNDAIDEESTARRLSGEDPQMVRSREEALRKALTADGGQGYWRTVLDFATVRPDAPEAYDDSYGIAIIYARLGEQAKAIDSLESAYSERQLAMTEIGVEPAFDVLRSDARFQGLLRRVGLAQ